MKRALCGLVGRSISLAVALGVCGVAIAAPAPARSAASGAQCGPAKAHTLASSAEGRVYVLHSTVYGCAGTHQFRLGQLGSASGEGVVAPIVVAGRVAAYATDTSGYDFADAAVHVRNLVDGKWLFSSPALSNPRTTGEGGQSVDSLVAKPDGNLAWIAKWEFNGAPIVEVHRRQKVLDQGRTIRAHSLKLHGSLLSWQHGSKTRHARLR